MVGDETHQFLFMIRKALGPRRKLIGDEVKFTCMAFRYGVTTICSARGLGQAGVSARLG